MLSDHHYTALLDILSCNTVTPMEGGSTCDASGLEACYNTIERLLTQLAPVKRINLSANIDGCSRHLVPERVRLLSSVDRNFFSAQPNVVFALGREERERKIVFNAHLDTVAPFFPVQKQGKKIFGRGAIDAKGPLICAVAALERSLECVPDLLQRIGLVFQCVAGEEGGAMGVYGTRTCFNAGYDGALHLFLEPSNGVAINSSTASMTAAIDVSAPGCHDDRPNESANATLILSVISVDIARDVAPVTEMCGAKLCLAGISTGDSHNRVYGSGRLLINIAYPNLAAAEIIAKALEECFKKSLNQIQEQFADKVFFSRTADAVGTVTKITWLKQGLPTLYSRTEGQLHHLYKAGFKKVTDTSEIFTCDAIWTPSGCDGAIVGPGDLALNGAHTMNEHVCLTELDRFTIQMSEVLNNFAQSFNLYEVS